MAQQAGDEATRTAILNKVALIYTELNAAFIRSGKLHGTLQEGVKNDIDGALLKIINFGVVADPVIVHNTMDRIELLKVDSGGYVVLCSAPRRTKSRAFARGTSWAGL